MFATMTVGILGFVIAIAMMAVIVSPVIVVSAQNNFPLALVSNARRRLFMSAYVAIVVASLMLGLSFANHRLNVFILVVALMFGVFLIEFSHHARVKFFIVPLALFGWLSLTLTLLALTGVQDRQLVGIGQNMYCQHLEWGSAISQGTTLNVFKRHLIVDYLVFRQNGSIENDYAKGAAPVGKKEATADLCRAAFLLQARSGMGS